MALPLGFFPKTLSSMDVIIVIIYNFNPTHIFLTNAEFQKKIVSK
jgi:hypothetical protein